MIESSIFFFPNKRNHMFPISVSVSSQLITNIISQLMVTTNSVMQLHQRLKNNNDTTTGTDNRNPDMLKELENAVMMTQSMLTKITSNK